MKVFTNLLFKVTLSSMVATAPAMITGSSGGALPDKEAALPYYSSTVIKHFIDHLTVGPIRVYSAFPIRPNDRPAGKLPEMVMVKAVKAERIPVEHLKSAAVVSTYIMKAASAAAKS